MPTPTRDVPRSTHRPFPLLRVSLYGLLALSTAGCGVIYGAAVPRRWRFEVAPGAGQQAARTSKMTYKDGLGSEHYAELQVACRQGAPRLRVEFQQPLIETRHADGAAEVKLTLGVGARDVQWEEVWMPVGDSASQAWLPADAAWLEALETSGHLGVKSRIPLRGTPAHLSFHTKGLSEVVQSIAADCPRAPTEAPSAVAASTAAAAAASPVATATLPTFEEWPN